MSALKKLRVAQEANILPVAPAANVMPVAPAAIVLPVAPADKSDPWINLVFRDFLGSDVHFKVKTSTRLNKVFELYCENSSTFCIDLDSWLSN